MRTKLENYNKNKSAFFYTYDNCYISNIIRSGEIYEKHLHDVFEEYITKDSVVLEGGCHIGSHSVKLSKLGKELHCFEPLEDSYNLLSKNLLTNKCKNTIIYNKALSDKNEKVNFNWIGTGNPGASGLENNPMGNILPNSTNKIAECITIDSLNLSKLDFIKLDIEGYEIKAIEGGINTIKKYKPIITLECWSDHQGNSNIENTKNIFKILLDIGYNVTQISYCDYLFLPSL